jgi:two-component system cell cycle sensor histidine kinase/response regulator CckA
MPPQENWSVRVLKRCPSVLAMLVIAIACVVLSGWFLHSEAIKRIGPKMASMKPNTAFCFLLAGAALWLRASRPRDERAARVAQILAATIFLVGVLTISETATGLNLGIDELLFRDTPGSAAPLSPGRMSLATAFFFALLGGSIFAPDTAAARRLSQAAAVIALTGSLLALMGYAYGIDSLYRITPYSSMALHTAATFVLLSAGTMLLRPNTQLVLILSSNSSAGILARRLLPAALVLPLCFGWLRLRGQHAGFYDMRFGMALFTLMNVSVFTALIYGTATLVYRIESERLRAEDKFRMVVESAPNGILVIDADGRIVLVNSQTERMFGYARDELLGASVETLLPDRFREAHPAHRKKFFADPKARRMGAGRDLYGRRKDGSEVPVEIGLNPIETADGVLTLSSIVDISERKAAAEQLHRHQTEMAHVARLSTMGEMAAGLAHEINQPLSAITNYADGCKNLLNGGSHAPLRVHDMLLQITSEGHRAAEIIRRLRRFVSKLEPRYVTIDINELVRDACALVAHDARNRGVAMHFNVDKSAPRVLGDAVQLQQVVVNLVLNGFEAMDQNQRGERALEIETRAGETGAEFVEIAFKDRGIGLPNERADRMFEAFYTTKRRGLGMGLSISRSIVEAHGGRLAAENRPGGGAVLRVSLPLAAGEVVCES